MIPFLDMKAVYAELKPELDAAYARVMESGWFVLGKEVEAFEAEYAAFCGTAHCVGLANGLEALELSLRAWRPTPVAWSTRTSTTARVFEPRSGSIRSGGGCARCGSSRVRASHRRCPPWLPATTRPRARHCFSRQRPC